VVEFRGRELPVRNAIDEGVRNRDAGAHREAVACFFRVAAEHEAELACEVERVAAAAVDLGDRREAAGVLHRDPFGAALHDRDAVIEV
jgi:hypothetical protein